MTQKQIRIHQLTPSTAVGDGVTTSLFFTQKLLRNLGYTSEIYADNIPDPLKGKIKHVSTIDDSQIDLLLIHHSMGHDLDELFEGFKCPLVMIYHNITPEKYFHKDAPEHIYSIKGRKQLNDWAKIFIGAIGVSPYNTVELEENNYSNITTLPLLIEMDKFGQNQAERPTLWGLNPLRPLLISIGRIVENKRQHLLLEAYWALKQMFKGETLPQLVIAGGTTSPNYDQALRQRILDLDLSADVLMPGKCSDQELTWLYQNADAYWCASEHEGFCMPLIEAGYFGLPVVAFASSNIPATLGKSGLIIEGSNPEELAAVTKELLEDCTLHHAIAQAGKDNLERYKASTLQPKLGVYLDNLLPTLMAK